MINLQHCFQSRNRCTLFSNNCLACVFVCESINSSSAAFDIYETSSGPARKGSITHANELVYLISSNRCDISASK